MVYLVSLSAWLLHTDKVFFFSYPVAHSDWVSDASAWNQVLLLLATSLSVEVKVSGVRGLNSTLIRWASVSVLHIN